MPQIPSSDNSESCIGRNSPGFRDTAPSVWRRHFHLVLDAYRADRANPLPKPPMTPDPQT